MARKLLTCAYLSALLCGVGGCPEGSPIEPDRVPTSQTWVTFTVEPARNQRVARGGTLRYQVRVQDKAALNAGVEFEVQSVPSGVTATIFPTRLSETGRDAEVTVQIPANAPLGEYDLTVRARLTFTGGAAPDWYEQMVPLDVVSGESGFSLICDPAEFTLTAGGSAQTLVCRVLRDEGFSEVIDLSFGPHQELLSINPGTARLQPNEAGFAFTVARRLPGAAPPTFSLRAIARGGGLERDFTVRILLPSAAAGR